jgi:hypothetical protein
MHLLNPLRHDAYIIEGTPFMCDPRTTPYVGTRLHYDDPEREWTIQQFLLPSKRRAIGGIRARVEDQKGFSTFCNQRDLEVLIGLGAPGKTCPWLRRPYVDPTSPDWVGFYADEEDLWDDLYERELLLRCDYPQGIPEGTTVSRLIHTEAGNDFEETVLLVRDWDRASGLYPDPRHSSVQNRWVRVERMRVTWEVY